MSSRTIMTVMPHSRHCGLRAARVCAGRPRLAEHQAEEGARAGAGGADHGDESAGRDVEIDALQHHLLVVLDPDVSDGNGAHQRRSSAWAQAKTPRERRARTKSIR